ncbi:MAG: hypothetical protein ACLFUJ_13390 [Phycisphaerae bacterium]
MQRRPRLLTIPAIALTVCLLAAADPPADPAPATEVNGLKVEVRPGEQTFHPTMGPVLQVRFVNTTDKPMHLLNPGNYRAWQFDGGTNYAIRAVDVPAPAEATVTLQPGKDLAVTADLSSGFQFQFLSAVGRTVPRDDPADGSMSISARIVLAAPAKPDGRTYWTGTIQTPAVTMTPSSYAIRPAGAEPAGAKLKAELVFEDTEFRLPLQKTGPGYRDRLLQLRSRGRLAPLAVPFSLKITNTSDKTIQLARTGDLQRLRLSLTGPGVLALSFGVVMNREYQASPRLDLEPGESFEIRRDTLSIDNRTNEIAYYWTQMGIYQIQATWQSSASGIEGVPPGGRITLYSQPVTIRVADEQGQIRPPLTSDQLDKLFQALVDQLAHPSFRKREQATKELLDMARSQPRIAERLRKLADAGHGDQEVLARVRSILAELEK